ncbi:MAG TPA: alpha/beta fold hydrolase [Thermoanaerobaculia bacterium]|nr:alpha/beta fold hydrolase [Thermoanaerobaculia bacterium]
MRKHGFPAAGLLALSVLAAAAAPHVHGSLETGKWAVGFRVLAERDVSRLLVDGRSRPIQVSVWYPASRSGGSPMTYRDYILLTASELSPENPPKEVDGRKAVEAFRSFLRSAHVTSPDASSLLATRMLAVSGAAPAAGRFPLVLVSQGNGQSAHDQAFLAEYLASHGYVVATVPSATRISGPMKSEEDIASKAEEQAADLAFAAREVRVRLRPREDGGIGVIGHSFGARAALLLAMTDSSIAALVSLDGGIGVKTGIGVLERSALFDAKSLSAPILHFYEESDAFMAPDFTLLDSLVRSRRILVRVPDMHHIHFTSVGALVGRAPSLAAATSAAPGTRDSFDAVCRSTLSFLDTFVKEPGSREKEWRPSDPDLLVFEKLEGPQAGDWIAGSQGRLRLEDGGTGGVPVLFVHGNGGNRTQWAGQLEHLRATRRAVAFDLRGMGESDPARNADYSVEGFAEDVAAVADARKLERFVLVGHSYGGAVVAAYAGKHPDRLAGLVFADVAGDIRNPPPAQAAALKRGFEPANYEEFTRRWFEAILVKGTDATKATVMKSLRATPREVFIAASNGLYRFDPVAALAPYCGPKLHIASFLADNPQAIHRAFPDMPVRVIPDASHWLMLDRPEEFNRLLDDFLRNSSP